MTGPPAFTMLGTEDAPSCTDDMCVVPMPSDLDAAADRAAQDVAR